MPNEQNGKAGKRLHVFETVITDRSDVFEFNGEKVRKNKKEHRCCRPVVGFYIGRVTMCDESFFL